MKDLLLGRFKSDLINVIYCMFFNYELNKKLPALAWLMILKKEEEQVEVIHGEHVECQNDFFVSGVWDGNFRDGEFDKAAFSCCTGAMLLKNVNRGG